MILLILVATLILGKYKGEYSSKGVKQSQELSLASLTLRHNSVASQLISLERDHPVGLVTLEIAPPLRISHQSVISQGNLSPSQDHKTISTSRFRLRYLWHLIKSKIRLSFKKRRHSSQMIISPRISQSILISSSTRKKSYLSSRTIWACS